MMMMLMISLSVRGRGSLVSCFSPKKKKLLLYVLIVTLMLIFVYSNRPFASIEEAIQLSIKSKAPYENR